jgi:predicted HTH transcriptional regulator
MKVEFIKERFYNGKMYKTGDIIDMPQKDYDIYQRFQAVKFHIPAIKQKTIDDMNFKELQDLCKRNNLSAAGKKEDLIARLNLLKENNVG